MDKDKLKQILENDTKSLHIVRDLETGNVELKNPQYHTFVGHVKRGTPAFELKQIMRIKKDLINQLKKAQKKIHKITSNTIKNGERISNKRFIKLNEKIR